jgi:hypothetical protein
MKFVRIVSLLLAGAGVLRAGIISPDTNLTAREEQIIVAAKTDAAPQFNGAHIIGIYTGTPLIFSLEHFLFR